MHGETHVHSRYEREIRALEKENEHLKEMLAYMADTLYQDLRNHALQPELEHLVVKWMQRCNAANLRALAARRRV